MKRYLLKLTSLVVTLAIVISCTAIALSSGAQTPVDDSQRTYTTCAGTCDYCPSIVIPGLFQSQTRMYDENGEVVTDADGDPIRQLMVNLSKTDIVKIVFKSIFPILASLILQRDVKLSDTVASIAADVLGGNAKNTDGEHINNIDVIKYNKSVARCTQEEKDVIYRTIPLSGYSEIAGEDHLYFFTYDSFGSISDIADELYDMIQLVKKETGHDKVNILPISQGGSIANELIERYKPQGIEDDLNRIVYIIPALDGSMLISEIFKGNFIKEDDMFYARLFPLLMETDQQWLAYLVNIALRLLPKQVAYNIIDDTVESLVETLLVNCTCMWALTTSADYQILSDKYLSGGQRDKIKQETDFYHQAQMNSRANIQYLQSKGVKVFDIIDYDYTFYPLFPGWDTINADGIINLDSTSMGATSAAVGEKLPEGYTQQNTYCTCTDGSSHISPSGGVDASTGVLCETSFYFRGQDHEGTGRNDVIMKLAIELITDKNFTSVHSYPDRYPQFNVGRESRDLVNKTKDAKNVDQTKLSAEDAAQLQAAIEISERVIAQTNVNYDDFTAANEQMDAILIKLGLRGAPEKQSTGMELLTKLLKFMSNLTYKYVGPRGYSDVVFGKK